MMFSMFFFKTVFENAKNTILVLSEKCSYHLNLEFFLLKIENSFKKTKKKPKRRLDSQI